KRAKKLNAPCRNCTTKNPSVAGSLSAAQNPANIRCEVNEIDSCNREARCGCARLPILFSAHGHSACAATGCPVRFLNSAERNPVGRDGWKSMCRFAYNFVL